MSALDTPTTRLPLGAIALARSGDKGAHGNIGVWVHDDDAYMFLLAQLTAGVVAEHFAWLSPGRVERFELPGLRALNFLLHDVLGRGGGAGGLRSDAQAKAYGQSLLHLELPIPSGLVANATRPPFRRTLT